MSSLRAAESAEPFSGRPFTIISQIYPAGNSPILILTHSDKTRLILFRRTEFTIILGFDFRVGEVWVLSADAFDHSLFGTAKPNFADFPSSISAHLRIKYFDRKKARGFLSLSKSERFFRRSSEGSAI